MILATSVSLGGSAVLLATGQPTELSVRVTSGTDVTLGGSAAACAFPIFTTDTEPFEVCLEPGEKLYANGTGTVKLIQFGLSATPA